MACGMWAQGLTEAHPRRTVTGRVHGGTVRYRMGPRWLHTLTPPDVRVRAYGHLWRVGIGVNLGGARCAVRALILDPVFPMAKVTAVTKPPPPFIIMRVIIFRCVIIGGA